MGNKGDSMCARIYIYTAFFLLFCSLESDSIKIQSYGFLKINRLIQSHSLYALRTESNKMFQSLRKKQNRVKDFFSFFCQIEKSVRTILIHFSS
jgi:hypothetical protein